jgi:hypothetical protein
MGVKVPEPASQVVSYPNIVGIESEITEGNMNGEEGRGEE